MGELPRTAQCMQARVRCHLAVAPLHELQELRDSRDETRRAQERMASGLNDFSLVGANEMRVTRTA